MIPFPRQLRLGNIKSSVYAYKIMSKSNQGHKIRETFSYYLVVEM